MFSLKEEKEKNDVDRKLSKTEKGSKSEKNVLGKY